MHDIFCDLGVSPLANSYVRPEVAGEMEAFFPLVARVCVQCLLVQLQEYASPAEIFTDYAYFSSWSTSWLDHAQQFADDAVTRFGLGQESLVVELASNDGYLLRWFAAAGIPVLGVEPAENVGALARDRGIPTISEFFGTEMGMKLAADGRADLIVANNVLAHVPDLHDFVGGIAALLAPDGRATIEFPHLLRLIAEVQFDTIYHEHFSYFSLHSLMPVAAAHGLKVTDIQQLDTHGGSLRLHLAHLASASDAAGAERVAATIAAEGSAGLAEIETYIAFDDRARARKRDILRFLIDLKEQGHSVAGYGAPAKANTMLNYCGIGRDFVDFTVDANPAKQGKLLPGSRIPVLAPAELMTRKPDVVLLLPWNLRAELIPLLAPVADWGGRLAVCHPTAAFL